MKKKKNLNRRDAIKTITFATPALAMQEFQTLKKISNIPLKGNIKQSVCQWCYDKMPLEDLAKQAKEIGCPTVDGLGMLLHQAVPGFERWFGVKPTVDNALRQKVLG